MIAYFSRVGNTDFADDVYAVTSASLLIKDNQIYGNTQYVAALVQKAAGGDLFLIETKEKYPSDYNKTDEQDIRGTFIWRILKIKFYRMGLENLLS